MDPIVTNVNIRSEADLADLVVKYRQQQIDPPAYGNHSLTAIPSLFGDTKLYTYFQSHWPGQNPSFDVDQPERSASVLVAGSLWFLASKNAQELKADCQHAIGPLTARFLTFESFRFN